MPRASAVPQSRAIANTERVLDAAQAVLIEEGWGRLTPKSVARASGLSQRAVQSRFPTRSHLATGLWDDRLCAPLQGRLEALLSARGLLGSPGQTGMLRDAMQSLAQPGDEIIAATELVIVSRFDPVLRGAVMPSLGRAVAGWCVPSGRGLPAATAARRAYLLGIGLGLIASGPTAPSPAPDLAGEAHLIDAALAEHRSPVTLPRAQAAHLRRRPLVPLGDPALEALLAATLEEVGERGFDDATTAGIARAAGHSEGLLYSRYPSKLDLFLDACSIQLQPGFAANEEYLARLTASHSRGVAEAALLREMLHPQADGPRTLNLEQVRLAWHTPSLRERMQQQTEEFLESIEPSAGIVPPDRDPAAYLRLAFAIPLGLVLLTRLHPDVWRLPFDVMTVPLEDG